MKHIAMVHSNVASVSGGVFTVDRKFHVGMTDYARMINAPLLTIHPHIPGVPIMDPISVPVDELPYRVVIGDLKAIDGAQLVYGCGMGSAALARARNIPYIPIVEYDLATEITVTTSQVKNLARKAVRTARCVHRWYRATIPDFKRAHSIHCNGYPIYDVARRHNKSTLLYLDSRMSKDMLITADELEKRLATQPLSGLERPLKLLYSGRYERVKGADDAVRVAVECLRRGLDIEMHCYGQGSLKSEMEKIATAAPPGNILIHDAIPYPELVKLSRTFDVFVCCHIQHDPSCTYLESFGAGLPIVGYGNRMWRGLWNESKAGYVSPTGRPALVADNIGRFLSDPEALSDKSRLALKFAQAHTYEREHGKRIDALIEAIA
jgi:colanic acid/amylovoran biosynthesis glycosyltransferase